VYVTGLVDAHGTGRADVVISDERDGAAVLDGASGQVLWRG
jgi:hypothetical protein